MEPDDLSEKLRAWRVEPDLPASFQRGVWQRVSTRQECSSLVKSVTSFEHLLGRPGVALIIVLIGLVVGIRIAREKAEETNTRLWRQLEARYTTSINPLAVQEGHLRK